MVETIEQEPAICIDAAKWGAAMERYRLAEMRFNSDWDIYTSLPDEHSDKNSWGFLIDQSSDEMGHSRRALLNTPAPDLTGLRWKLDQILTFEESDDGQDDCLEGWSREYVGQTIADYKRLLPA